MATAPSAGRRRASWGSRSSGSRPTEEREKWVGSGLILVARGGARCQFVAPQGFCTTSRLYPGGVVGVFSYLSDDWVLLHVRQRRKYVKRLRPEGRERRRG
jgi:hypothetical protein